MLLKYFYDEALAHASYLVGCQQSGEAIVVDPGRDVEPYLRAAEREELRIVGVAETHIHADYVSGARELAARIDARLYVSDAGPPEWKYLYLDDYPHQLLQDSDTFRVGELEFQVLHTPGHTPESLSFLLTDRGGSAHLPMGIFTGDFVFVGAVGRPDLLEEAAGVERSAVAGAQQLFHALERFKAVPDYLQIWPAHGAGSVCGKGLGAIPSSTVGYETRFNPGLQFEDEATFVSYILADQPEVPPYFAVMKRVNKEGPAVLNGKPLPGQRETSELSKIVTTDQVVDTSASSVYAKGHVPGTINIPPKYLGSWGGWLIDYTRPLYLIANRHDLPEVIRVLYKIGVDDIAGFFDADQVAQAKLNTETYQVAAPQELAEKIRHGEVQLIDVRAKSEWDEKHIPSAQHMFLGRLPEQLKHITRDRPVVAQCRADGRSGVAVSLLQAAGIKEAINLIGGIEAWIEAGLPVVGCEESVGLTQQ